MFSPAAVNILHDEMPGSHFQSFISEVVINGSVKAIELFV